MSRPLRIEFAGAVYHLTARGDRRELIFEDDQDRACLLGILAQGLERFDAKALAYCLMGNHYHFVLQTGSANLSRLMRHIKGVYTQTYNRRRGLDGHLFQGRFKAVLVDRDSYLMEVCRYVELNPVRAGIVAAPGDWAWSSYRAHTGVGASPDWLDTPGLYGFLLGQDALSPSDCQQAAAMYAGLVAAGRDVKLWDMALRQQICLGSEAFVERMQEQATPPPTRSSRGASRPARSQHGVEPDRAARATARRFPRRRGTGPLLPPGRPDDGGHRPGHRRFGGHGQPADRPG